MQLFSFITLLGAATLAASQSANVTTGKLGDAKPVRHHPAMIGETWIATFNSSVAKGTVTVVAAPVGVNYAIVLTGLPAAKGPFKYHVHVKPVPEDGNCTATAGHLDPYERGTSPACDSSKPQTCEVGDLSGKYGTVPGPDVKKWFNDPYSALNPSQTGYIGGRSIVFHDGSGARIACATLVMVDSGIC